MIIAIEFIFVLSMLIGSLAALLNAITKFRIAAATRSAVAQSQPTAQRTWARRSDLFFVVLGMAGMLSSVVYIVWMLSQPDGPVTEHQVLMVAMCIANVITGNLLLSTITIKQYVA
jgi:hypothetical protein